MKIWGNKNYSIVMIALIIIGAGSYRLGICIFGSDSYSFCIDSQLSASMQHAIKDVAHASCCLSLSRIAHAITQACPAVGAIALERRANKMLHVIITAGSPYLCFSDQHVLLKTGQIVDKESFAPMALNALPVVNCHDAAAAQLSADFKHWLLQLDSTLFAHYAVTWKNDYEIYLGDKQDNHKSILCSVNTPVTEKMSHMCQRIIEKKKSDVQGTAQKSFLTADIRFEKQIIICSQKGGACHG
jgi:hypothetical protein